MQANSKPHSRLGCLTISFRNLALDEALASPLSSAFLRSIWPHCPGTRFPT